jgi:hypothetical protein
MLRINTGMEQRKPNQPEPNRPVYVVGRVGTGGGAAAFVPAELQADGTPREHETLEAAEAARKRLGGAAAGWSVFTEFRNNHGAPCAGRYIET